MKPTKLNAFILIQIELLLIANFFAYNLFQYVRSNPSVKEAVSLATTVKAEPFTELYFENHSQLPKKIVGWNTYPFSFTIHNLEDKDMEYSYSVYTIRDGKKIITYKEDKVAIKKGEYKTITATIKALKPLNTKVVVDLTDKNQIISFNMEK